MNSSTKSRTVVATSLARLASNNGFLSRSPTPPPPPSVVEKSLTLAKNTNCSIGSQMKEAWVQECLRVISYECILIHFVKTFHGHSYSKIEKDQDIIYIKILLYE